MNIFNGVSPDKKPDDIISWAERNVKVDGHSFDSIRTPQLIEPIRAMADAGTRVGTLVKPVQVGGSTAGEVVLAYWAAYENGLIQFNWETDLKAKNRWNDRILPALESCDYIKRTGRRFEEMICEARYVNTTVRVQGVFSEDALDSDTVPLQINEEIHSWKPGYLSKARRRQTQVWNAKALDISNAGTCGDQLHAAYEDGTAEVWEIICPSCGGNHVMQFRYNPNKPELGGLRWDSEGCKQDDGRFDYNRLERTIHYQFPCGHTIKDHATERRQVRGQYRVTNTGAHISKRSWNFDAVSCDAIRWLTLIQEWHSAIRSVKSGDREPMRRFVTERECRFWNDELVPFQGAIILRPKLTKNRDGLPDRAARLWAADKQKGWKSKGELSHYWLVIRDVMDNCDSRLVFEGKVDTDVELLTVLDEHNCKRYAGGVDASWDTKSVLELCYRNGLNAFMGNASHKGWFTHAADKVKRFYSEGKPIHLELNMPPRFEYSPTVAGWLPSREEPSVIQYGVAGLLANLFFVRDHELNVTKNGGDDFILWEVPGDASEDYRNQLESWERTSFKQQKTQEEVEGFKKVRKADHMTMCEGYISMMMDIGGFIGNRMVMLGIRPKEEKE